MLPFYQIMGLSSVTIFHHLFQPYIRPCCRWQPWERIYGQLVLCKLEQTKFTVKYGQSGFFHTARYDMIKYRREVKK